VVKLWKKFRVRRNFKVAKLKITLIRGINKAKEDQVATVKALGLRKIRSTVEQNDNPQIRGMINKVSHLLDVQEI
jgi:large subunit ribosomal protein L30